MGTKYAVTFREKPNNLTFGSIVVEFAKESRPRRDNYEDRGYGYVPMTTSCRSWSLNTSSERPGLEDLLAFV